MKTDSEARAFLRIPRNPNFASFVRFARPKGRTTPKSSLDRGYEYKYHFSVTNSFYSLLRYMNWIETRDALVLFE